MDFLQLHPAPRRKPQKYRKLLVVLALTFVLSPFLGRGIGNVISVSLLLLTILLIIRSFTLPRRSLWFYSAIASLVFCLEILRNLGRLPALDPGLSVLSQAIFLLYFSVSTYWIGRDIFLDRQVNADKIQGGICVYLLIGFMWALMYGIVGVIDPHAFSQQLIDGDSYLKPLHFSFTTLTTLGYGDIVPLSKIAQVLTSIQAIVGQMYSTILIAILTGSYLSERGRS